MISWATTTHSLSALRRTGTGERSVHHEDGDDDDHDDDHDDHDDHDDDEIDVREYATIALRQNLDIASVTRP